jgi:class 3 adenylate cyclase
MTLRTPRSSPLLRFEDPALEEKFWEKRADERRTSMQRAYVLLVACTIAFTPLEGRLFPEHAPLLHSLRALMVALMLAPAPWILFRRGEQGLRHHAQAILLYLTLVAVGGLLTMHWVVLPQIDELPLLSTVLSAIFGLMCVQGISGLRPLYSAPVAAIGCAAFVGAIAARSALAPRHLGVISAFVACQWIIGLWVSWGEEQSARREFLDRLALERARTETESLLLNLMPESFAIRLKRGDDTLERVGHATIVFATVVGFDAATQGLSALETVELLDQVVSRFDRMALQCGVERIKSIGPTYMAAAGIASSEVDGKGNAIRAAKVALAMRAEVRALAESTGLPLALRVGVASGPVVAGVIGTTRIAFDCWGDTANLAARLDTHGAPGRIHLATSTAELLSDDFSIEARGPTPIKGKGTIETAWLEPAVPERVA